MSLKSLLVFADDSEASERRLETAIAMAEAHGAHLAACAALEQPAYYYGIGSEVAADVYLEDVERVRALAEEVAGKAERQLAKAGHDGGVSWETGVPAAVADIAARHARYADLTLLGQPFEGPQETLLWKVFEGVLFDSGRPFAVLPAGWSGGAFGKRVMIAWSPCREAARAVGDALPFIESAEEVRIAMVDPETGDDAHGAEPGADLATALARHAAKVSVDQLPSSGMSIGGRLLKHAEECGTDLVVMGGYGHWRLREILFGGVTREMLRASPVPLLLAH
ncbi:MAG TPA: universal stress protein [Thermohalobaculum sp.]|nr:universal stress protein [Thermohalobaculum sp.]